MSLPKTISDWCLVLFFLLFGLAQFVPSLAGGFFPFIWGILALGFVVFRLLGR